MGYLIRFYSEAFSTEIGGSWRKAPRGVNRAEYTLPSIKKDTAIFRKRWIASALDSYQIYSKTLHCVVQC